MAGQEQEQDRRRYGRIEFEQPLAGAVGEVPVRVADVSVVGFRVLHEARFPPGEARQIRIEWNGRSLRFACNIIRSTLVQLARTPGEKSTYQSGVDIISGMEGSEDTLREFIADRIIHALDAQKKNARGITPLSSEYTYQIGKSDGYRKCEFIDGKWTRKETRDFAQPSRGFTISDDIDKFHVDLLCKTWETTTEEGRRLIQILAELSIKKTEGGPTRRYVP